MTKGSKAYFIACLVVPEYHNAEASETVCWYESKL